MKEKLKGVTPHYAFPPEIDVWHSPKHWANTELTKWFIEKIILPHINQEREANDLPQIFQHWLYLTILQTNHNITDVLESNHIFVPAWCTDHLQALDVSVNKAAKDHLRRQFWSWYVDQVWLQLDQGTEVKGGHYALSYKTPSAKWLVSMWDYLRSKPEIIVNKFKKAGIKQAIEDQAYEVTPEPEYEDPFVDLSDWLSSFMYNFLVIKKFNHLNAISTDIFIIAIFF